MWFNQVKTAVLLATLSGLLMLFGGLVGGMRGLTVFFIISLIINVIAYFFSDKIVLRMYRAQPLDRTQYDWIYAIVEELAEKSKMPMPKLWLVPMPIANAFATGRNPKHASVAITTGILDILDKEELRGVLAHELSHVINRDILVSTVAATLASTIGFLAQALQNMFMWGGLQRNRDRQGMNPLLLLVVAILMPIAASLIQMAISRAREYLADESGSEISHDPLALASALEKLDAHTKQVHFGRTDVLHATTAHMMIVKPFLPGGITALFSTHPPMHKRIARLRKIYEQMIGK